MKGHSADLSLPDGPLNLLVSDIVCDGVTNSDAVTLDQQVVVDHCLDVSIELPGYLVAVLHDHDVHQGATLVAQGVLGEDATYQDAIHHNHLRGISKGKGRRDGYACDVAAPFSE